MGAVGYATRLIPGLHLTIFVSFCVVKVPQSVGYPGNVSPSKTVSQNVSLTVRIVSLGIRNYLEMCRLDNCLYIEPGA